MTAEVAVAGAVEGGVKGRNLTVIIKIQWQEVLVLLLLLACPLRRQ